MEFSHRKHYASLARSALGLSKLRIEPRTERASRHVLAHSLTAREAAGMLDCASGEVEALVQARTLVGRHVKWRMENGKRRMDFPFHFPPSSPLGVILSETAGLGPSITSTGSVQVLLELL